MTKKSGASGVIRRIGLASSKTSGSSSQVVFITHWARNRSRIWVRGLGAGGAGQVVDAVVRDGELHGGVGVLEAGLPLGRVRGEGGRAAVRWPPAEPPVMAM